MLLSCTRPVALGHKDFPDCCAASFLWFSSGSCPFGIGLGSGQSCQSPFVYWATLTSINHHNRLWAPRINDPFSDDVDLHGLFHPLLAASGTTPQCIPSRPQPCASPSTESRHYARSSRQTFSSSIQEHLSSSRNTFLLQSRRRRRRWRSLPKMH